MSELAPAVFQFPLFEAYAAAKMQRLAYLDSVLQEGMPIVEDHEAAGGTNERLIALGRPDLVITDPATMMSISHPLEVAGRCNNFTPNFHIYTGRRETGELNLRDEPIWEPIPATTEEILALRSVPKINRHEEVVALRESGEYPAFSQYGDGHSSKPAFIRMLNLFPDFTAMLVTETSDPENHYDYTRFEAELFVAYQLMSRLVDKSDLYVLNEEGGTEAWYLCK